mmetsp:Transcript_31493/g.48307  ORF Transcript_31493/g.48307 Transcript_31493/m.48307 type:complete len:815 (+) Transcript_31493:262-2706(+)
MALDVIMQRNKKKDDADEQTIADLYETISMLRTHNKELEESMASKDPELKKLRKELSKVEEEKAQQELDFMNQLAAAAGSNESSKTSDETVEQLKRENARLQRAAENEKILRASVQELQGHLGEFRKVHISETSKLKAEAKARMKEMKEQSDDLQTEKSSLISEISDLRLQLDKETQEKHSFESQCKEMKVNYESISDQLKEEKKARQEAIERHEMELGELNDNLIDMETNRAGLLDDMTRYQKQAERESKRLSDYKSQMSEMQGQMNNAAMQALEERATTAETQVKELRGELEESSETYKKQIAQLSETIAAREHSLTALGEEVVTLKNVVEEGERKALTMSTELSRAQRELDTQTALAASRNSEIETLTTQRESFEQRSTRNLEDQVKEVDSLREQNDILYKEVDSLVERLNTESELVEKLKLENDELKANVGTYGSKQGQQSQRLPVARAVAIDSDSPRSSVKNMVACFEQGSASTDSVSASAANALDAEQLHLMQEKLDSQAETISDLRAEISEMSLTKQKGGEENTEEMWELKNQLEEVASELNGERRYVQELKQEIEELKDAHWDDKPWNNETEIASLKAELEAAQLANSDMQNIHVQKVQSLEESVRIMQAEADEDVAKKEKEISELQVLMYTLEDQITIIKKEKEQLRIRLNNLAGSNNDELDELQTELIDKTRLLSKMSRQLKTMESQLQEETEERTKELNFWKNKVKQLEAEKNRQSSKGYLSENTMNQMKSENMKLRGSVAKLTKDREALQEKLKSFKSDKPGQASPHYVQRLKEKNIVLKKEVERLQKRSKDINGSVSRVEI